MGGGPAALCTAIHLRQLDISTVLLARAKTKHRVGEVLAPTAREHFRRLGVLGAMSAVHYIGSAGVSAWWGTPSRQDWDYIFDPYGSGWHIDRAAFEDLLLGEAQRLGVDVREVHRIGRCLQKGGGNWELEYVDRGGQRRDVTGRLIVNAAGRTSQFNNITGARRFSDFLIACYCYFRRNELADCWTPRLWVEATPEGWWYSAPLPGGKAVAVFLTDGDLLEKNAEETFRRRLRDAPNTLGRLAEATQEGRSVICSARSSFIHGEPHPSSLSVGDAAYTSDPLRGYGLLQAMKQSEEAAAAIGRYLSGADCEALAAFRATLLARYTAYYDGICQYYSKEDRWGNRPFWARRQSSS